MTKIQVFLNNQVDQVPWAEIEVPTLPRKGDLFKMEKGRLYKVDSIVFSPEKDKVCSIQVWLDDPTDSGVQETAV